VTITNGATTKSITVSTGTASGSVTVNVTTDSGNTVTKTKAISVKQLSDIVTFDYTGTIESWTVPKNVELIKIEAWGGSGGNSFYNYDFKHFGGKGARMRGEFNVAPGDKLLVLVGGKGEERKDHDYVYGPGAGGGGTFVVKVDDTSSHQMTIGGQEKVSPLIIAGGGGGGGIGEKGQPYDGGNGLTGNDGGDAFDHLGGRNGLGGAANNYGGGGAGFSGDGTYPNGLTQPKSFLNGGMGGSYDNNYAKATGGFGGGGGAGAMPGGGGGYSGGASGGSWATKGRSAGGGSYNDGANQSNSPGVRVGNGRVQISW
jgi:hypothetical protein